MTLGEKIKSLRNKKGMTQESLAEELNVSRSTIAKWENDIGIPEISNLKLISRIFHVSLDDLLDDETSICTSKVEERKMNSENIKQNYANWYCTIDLVGWNDGVDHVLVLGEDEDFLFYKKEEKKRTVYGMLGKKYVASIRKESKCSTLNDTDAVDRNYFCNRNVLIEIACKEGLLKGFFDFRSDDYMDVYINAFDNAKIILDFGRELEISSITKIEEL